MSSGSALRLANASLAQETHHAPPAIRQLALLVNTLAVAAVHRKATALHVTLGPTVIQQECLVGNYLLCYCFSVDKELNHLGQCSTRLYCDAVLGSFDSRFMGSIEHMKTRKELERIFSGAKIVYS